MSALNIKWVREWLQEANTNINGSMFHHGDDSWFGCDTDEELEMEIREVANAEKLNTEEDLEHVLEVMLFG